MRKILILFSIVLLASCGASKKRKSQTRQPRTVSVPADTNDDSSTLPSPKKPKRLERTKADDIIKSALEYSGVRYKFGGTTKKGMDCSGLLYVAFGENDVDLPRTSYHMAEEGKNIKIKDVEKGDLLFFRTSRRAKRINHVGMVVAVEDNEIKFVHASTSRGVIVSSLREGYWNSAFVKATRVL
ncbi:C40 family peptidase [Cytophaga sp. FL35]|uniref:C40 family peptidase n=1 Tax=Cytophaga sp. FL35 TaxID=1904456 RepID=UPI001653ACA4|nr:C40 family peptidase [Cytophaga sp. FL35]MBC6998960.1 C40 family peptidase [Cytophaga sp. FL35]